MYISDINKKLKNNIVSMFIVSIICLIFSTIYNHFGHGIYSFYMTFLFLWSLIGGAWYVLLLLLDTVPNRISINTMNAGVATLTAGSLVKGISEIAGTYSNYEIGFFIFGTVFVFGGIMSLTKWKHH